MYYTKMYILLLPVHDIHVCVRVHTYTVPLVTKQIKMYFLLRRQLKILIAKEQLQQQ